MPVMDRNISLGDGSSEDLPRTLRRERDAQQRALHQQMSSAASQSSVSSHSSSWPLENSAQTSVVTAFKVPFFKLMLFYLKSVVAAIPAILLLLAILWGIGHALIVYFPWLVKVQILIQVPK